MTKTNAMRALLNSAIAEIAPAYYSNATDGHPSDYIVYTITELSTEDGATNAQAEINCMGYGRDTATTEEMADEVQKALDHAVLANDDVFLFATPSSRNIITEEDKKIIRRRLIFDIRMYERS